MLRLRASQSETPHLLIWVALDSPFTLVNLKSTSIDVAGGGGVAGGEGALSNFLVGEGGGVLEGVPHVAVVGRVVVVGEGLRARAGLDGAVSGGSGEELEGDVVDILLDGGGAGQPEVGVLQCIHEFVDALAGVTVLVLGEGVFSS